MLLETFPVGPFEANCSVLACEETRQAVVIDPGGGVDRIRALVARHGLTVTAILHTHGHLDHVSATAEVKQAPGGEIWLHEDDLPTYRSWPAQAVMFGLRPGRVVDVDRFLRDGDVVPIGRLALSVIHTPGHSPGSVCFRLDREGETLIFSGDTLFQRGVGRTDLPGGDTRKLIASIRTRLYTLPPTARVIPGHGDPTTIGEEMADNPFVRA
jgi:glyoxylase-like metal-dependent hydrolase (beta-lactamase superfamily II)